MTDVEGDNGSLNELRSYLSKHMSHYDKHHFYSPAENYLLPAKFRELQQKIHDMEVYEDDTWILTYPRSGTTWSRAMLWLMANDLDYSGSETDLMARFPFLEVDVSTAAHDAFVAVTNSKYDESIDYVRNLKRPRFIWSHLPLSLLPSQLLEKKPKIVLVIRNPKDVAVSRYHFDCSVHSYTGTIEKYFECFMKGLLVFGCYWHHLGSFRKLYEEPNVLSFTYEDMKQDYMGVLKKTASFFGKNYTDDELKKLENYLSFSNMKENQSLNVKEFIDKIKNIYKSSTTDTEFIRKGVVGSYRDEMSDESVEKFDEWSLEMKKKLNLIDDNKIPY